MTCARLDELLLDGTDEAMEAASRHAEDCAECAATLTVWNDISATAHDLRVSWRSDFLLPRIQRELRVQRPTRIRRLIQIAAVLLLTVGIGATVLQAVRSQVRDAAYDDALLRVAALDEVEAAERAYVASIERMESLAADKLEDPPSPLMISYKEKLMLLDAAIAECEVNIDQNRQNAHLRKQLLAIYSQKQQTLGEVLRRETNFETR